MSPVRNADYLLGLVHELTELPRETEWVEFKTNNDDPQQIGEYISALANSAALHGRSFGYLVWGVEDGTHAIIGTTVDPKGQRKGQEELENWLLRNLVPRVELWFHEVSLEGKRLVILEVEPAADRPVEFAQTAYVRIGSYKQKLKEYPEKERLLWRRMQSFEEGGALENIGDEAVVTELDYPTYFRLTKQPLPRDRSGILAALAADKVIRRNDAGLWNITNLGAILLANDLRRFPTLERKALRVIHYKGPDRTETLHERDTSPRGYASDFEGVIEYLSNRFRNNEVIERALRKVVPEYPVLAVRELVANALIHQDFSVHGAGPMVELFSDRLEIRNPGRPLVDPDRFVDAQPQSRNDKLASLMRRMYICEERGSGIDKVVSQVEAYQLPAPLFDAQDSWTRVVLFAPRPIDEMSSKDRARACYLHACLKYVSNAEATNTTVRERFGLEDSPSGKSRASRYLREALDAKLIVSVDPKAGRKHQRYVPFWAAAQPPG